MGEETLKPLGERLDGLVGFESARECEWGCNSWLGSKELLLAAALRSFPVADSDEVILSAKKPSLLEEARPSDRSIVGLEVKTLRLVSFSPEIAPRNRVVAGVGRGVASLEVRLFDSEPSSSSSDLAELES